MSSPRASVRAGVLECIRLFPRVSRALTAGLVVLLLITALLPTAFRLASGAMVGALPAAVRTGPGSDAAHRVIWLAVLLALMFAVQQAVGPVMAATADAMGRRVTGHLRNRVMRAAAGPAGIGHLEDPAVLDIVSRAHSVGTSTLTPQQVVGSIVNRTAAYLMGAASVVLLMGYSWWLALGLAATYLVLVRQVRQDFHRTIEVVTGQAQALRRSTYFRDVGLTPAASKEIRVFGLAPWVVDRFHRAWWTPMEEAWRRRRGSLTLFVAPAVFFVTDFGAFAIIGRSAVRGEISLGELTVYTSAVMGIGAFNALGQDDFNLQYGAPVIPAVRELETVAASPVTALGGVGSSADRPQEMVRFEGVSFAYPGRDTEVFRGLDLEIAAGHSLAIVGANGAGKTTLVKLLARLYEPSAGRITVDGVDLREFAPDEWQRRVGAVFQDFIRYQLSAADNVGFGASDAAALRRAAERAGCLELIEELPRGWDTVLSRQFADGVELSGGQWQRVALARALYAVETGANVLVLDEPTANLDVRAEAVLYDQFLDLTAGLTTLLISHRFSTVRHADRIVVLDDGRVVEDGSHDDLVAAGGRYAEMYALQAARFRA